MTQAVDKKVCDIGFVDAVGEFYCDTHHDWADWKDPFCKIEIKRIVDSDEHLWAIAANGASCTKCGRWELTGGSSGGDSEAVKERQSWCARRKECAVCCWEQRTSAA